MSVAISSMTGFGAATAELKGWRVQVACKSVNHRGLDVRVHAPPELRWIEPQVLRLMRRRLHRGRIEVRVDLERSSGEDLPRFDRIDEGRFEVAALRLSALAKAYGLTTPISLGEVLTYRDFFERSTEELFSEAQSDALLPVFKEALTKLIAARQSEGEGIAAELQAHLSALNRHLDEAEALKEGEDLVLRTRLQVRLEQTLEDFGAGEVDAGRVAQELAMVVERGDISEELQRARSHVEHLTGVIAAGQEGVGKKIDFYLQEMIRESNTMGSKSHHSGLTNLVIEMKSLIEKMREQAANIE